MEPPPYKREWLRAEVGGALSARSTLIRFPDEEVEEVRALITQEWDKTLRAGSALFERLVASLEGEPVEFINDVPLPNRISQPGELWFVSNAAFAEVWGFAKHLGFSDAKLSESLERECDQFLTDISSRHPIGLEMVGPGCAAFRRLDDGGQFELADMKIACRLNVAVAKGPLDASHKDRGMPRHFVRKGFFYLGM